MENHCKNLEKAKNDKKPWENHNKQKKTRKPKKIPKEYLLC